MFLNLIMLAGLGGAVVPLVLHMLSRARYRSIDWGAMMFLTGAKARRSHSSRLRQIALLALRMATVALLALALARPVARGRWGMLAQDGPITAVLVIDRSYSMTWEDSGRSRFEIAREAALQILSGLRPGDRAALVCAGDVNETPFEEPTTDVQAVARHLTELRPPTGTMETTAALWRAADLLDRSEGVGREVYVLCDRQGSNWNNATPAFATAWKQRMAKSKAPTRLVVIPVGGEEMENVAIESVQVLTWPVIRETLGEVEVRIRNYGRTRRTAIPLTVAVQRQPGDESRTYRRSVTVEAGGTAVVRLPVVFASSLSQIISARIEAAGLAADNRYDLAISALDRLKVLVVSGDEREPPAPRPEGISFRSESAFVQLALNPYKGMNHERGGNMAELTIRKAQDWAGPPLKGFSVVILANVPQFSPAQARALEQFVYEGGGVLIAPGNLARVESYNDLLYRGGSGIMPAKLQPALGGDWSASTTIGSLDLQHPVFRQVRGWEPAPSSTIAHYFPATPRPTEARVIGSYASGDPFLVEGTGQRGRVVLMTTPLDLDWGNLPLSSFYLPFLQSTARYLSPAPQTNRNPQPGEPLIAELDDPPDERSIDVAAPDERPMNRPALKISPSGQKWQVRYGDTQTPGIYRMSIRGAQLYFVAQMPRGESDLAPLTRDRWDQLEKGLGFTRLEGGRGNVGSVIAGTRSGRELWLLGIAAAVLLSVLELWAAGRWSRGAAA